MRRLAPLASHPNQKSRQQIKHNATGWQSIKALALAKAACSKNDEYFQKHGRNETSGNQNPDGLRARVEAFYDTLQRCHPITLWKSLGLSDIFVFVLVFCIDGNVANFHRLASTDRTS